MATITDILSSSEDTMRWPTFSLPGVIPRDEGNPRRWLIHQVGVHPGDIGGGALAMKVGDGVIVCENIGPRYKARVIEIAVAPRGSGRLFDKLVVDVYDKADWFHQRSSDR